jgi:glycosyltransferase involved in cell wall biosynthesis
MRTNLQSGFIRMLTDGFIRPFFKTMDAKKYADIFHATDEFCCFYFPLLRKSKKVVTFHHVMSKDDRDSRFLLVWRLVAWMGVKRADKIVAISNQTRDEIMHRYGISADKIAVIPNKLPDNMVPLNVDKKNYIGCVSTLTSRKNLGALIRVFKVFQDTYGMDEYGLKICGKGPEERALRTLAENLGIDGKVEFISDLKDDELIRFYNEANLIANPSMHEGFGRITLEAQLCSTPVIFFKNAAIPEEVTKAAVPAEDESDFARNMYELLTNKELYVKVSQEGLEYARSFQGVPEELLDLYKELSC